MNDGHLVFEDLKATLEDIGARHRNLSPDDLFVLWFFRAYVTESEDLAAEAVAGGSRDKGIDGIFIDDAARVVFVVQAKYRRTLGEKTEGRDTALSFAELAHRLTEEDSKAFAKYTANMQPHSAEKLKTARNRVLHDGYSALLYFVTTGKVAPSARDDAAYVAQKAKGNTRIEILDGRRLMLLLRDYLDGVAPPIPTLDLEMEKGPNVTVNGVSQRYDDLMDIESWVFSMRGDRVGALYDFAGPRIFARNIRGYLGGATDVNRSMVATLKDEPERFFYYNNGITILCDEAVKRSVHGRDVLQVGNPQIINGQQTTRALAAHPAEAARGSVLVKVIRVPREADNGHNGFESLVSRIVAGTNWQNKITASDLMSNDRVQIDLERSFRKIGYVYIRKRQSKGEARRTAPKNYHLVKKEEIATAVAGCDLDPYVLRLGKENLFEEEFYGKVFPNTDPDFYLTRYRLLRDVTYWARGNPQRGYAKWLVLNFVWSRVAPLVRVGRNARAFRLQCESMEADLVVPLGKIINKVFAEVMRYYRHTRGKGAKQLDISRFFRDRKGHDRLFERFWSTRTTAKVKFNRAVVRVQEAIEDFEE